MFLNVLLCFKASCYLFYGVAACFKIYYIYLGTTVVYKCCAFLSNRAKGGVPL